MNASRGKEASRQACISPLDVRRRRLAVRCHTRGTKEACVLLKKFLQAGRDTLDEQTLDALELLLQETDQDIVEWVGGNRACPDEHAFVLALMVRSIAGSERENEY